MKKNLLGLWLIFCISVFLVFTAKAVTYYTTVSAEHLLSSLIDSTPIGSTTPSSGAFTTLSSSAGITGNLTGNVTGNASTATGINSNGSANQVWGMNSGASAQGWQTVTSPFTGTSGYQTLPNGLVLEWVNGPSESANFSGTVSVSLPFTFPHACFSVQLTTETPSAPTGNAQGYSNYLQSCSTTTVTAYMDVGADSVGTVTHNLTAFAIGY